MGSASSNFVVEDGRSPISSISSSDKRGVIESAETSMGKSVDAFTMRLIELPPRPNPDVCLFRGCILDELEYPLPK